MWCMTQCAWDFSTLWCTMYALFLNSSKLLVTVLLQVQRQTSDQEIAGLIPSQVLLHNLRQVVHTDVPQTKVA